MCTRSCLHSSASATTNSASARRPRHQYSSRRNPASSTPARSSPAPPWTQHSPHAILNATATASHRLQVLSQEPEDDDAVAGFHHGDTPDIGGRTRQLGQQRLNNKLRARREITRTFWAR